MSKRIDLTGQKFGHWTVLKYDKNSKWICQCECGTIKSVNTVSLRKGTSTSCGCYRTKNSQTNNGKFIDETGNRYGRLLVIEQDVELSKQKHRAYWICKCDCGNYKTVSSRCLRNGKTKSCGCMLSVGEELIAHYLQDKKIYYTQQYSFPSSLYRYDFALLNDDNSLKALIEFNGIQHYQYEPNTHGWNTEENYNQTVIRDKAKIELAKQYNIPLYIIPYWDIDNLDNILTQITKTDIEEAQEIINDEG